MGVGEDDSGNQGQCVLARLVWAGKTGGGRRCWRGQAIGNTEVSIFLLLIFVPVFLLSILWKVFANKNNVVC